MVSTLFVFIRCQELVTKIHIKWFHERTLLFPAYKTSYGCNICSGLLFFFFFCYWEWTIKVALWWCGYKSPILQSITFYNWLRDYQTVVIWNVIYVSIHTYKLKKKRNPEIPNCVCVQCYCYTRISDLTIFCGKIFFFYIFL